MKNYYRSLRCVLTLVFFTGTVASLKAQSAFDNSWEIGLGAGYTNYYGDLSNYRISKFSNIFKVFDYNRYYTRKPSLSILLQKQLTPALGLMLQGNVMQFGMSDRYRKNNGSIDTDALHYSRSLNFRTDLQDIGLAFNFDLNNGRVFPVNAFFYPSFYIGAGISRFDVKGDLFDENGNPYNYQLQGDINDGDYESNLRDFRTETANRFRNVEPYANFGIGLNLRVNEVLTIALQSDIKYSASDYLDDVSSKYKSFYATPAELYAARPGYNLINPVTLQRGDDNSRNDFYINNRVVLRISMLRKPKEKPFSPPVIYSMNLREYRNKVFTPASPAPNPDSIQIVNEDSLKRLEKDSLQSVDRAIDIALLRTGDSTIQIQLQSINAELQHIRSLLGERSISPRQVQLQYQADSVKLLRNGILLQRYIGREDSLRMRVFDLQIDSLRYEWENVHSGMAAVGTINSRRSGYVPDAFNKSVVPGLSKSESNPLFPASDSRVLSNETIAMMRRDERYRTNSVYRSEVDSLELRLKTYQEPVITNSGSAKRIDSLQRILDELELRSYSDPSSMDTLMRQRFQDSVTYEQQLRKYQQRKQQQRVDSISSYQQRLQRYNDSSAYYARQINVVSPVTQDTLQTKRRWYQRIFSRNKSPERVTDDTVTPGEYAKRREYYEAEAEVVNRRIEKMRRDSASVASATDLNNVTYEQQAAELDRMLRMNADSLQSIKGQIRRSNDSAMYYDMLVQKNQDAAAALEQERKWYNNIFTSGKKVRERAEKDNNARNQSREQQRQYDLETNRMRTRMNEMETRNRELNREYQLLNLSRESINRYQSQRVAPQVIYESYARPNTNGEYYNNYNEINALRDELARLKNQVNDSPHTDTVIYKAPGIDTSVSDSVYLKQNAGDASQLSSLRREIEQLRAEMAIMQNAKPTVVVERTKEPPAKFDASLFPVISVYFKTGSVVAGDDQLDRMMPFVQVALKNPEIPVLLKGFTDPVGNAASNSVLARKRTAHIKSILVTRFNIAANRITVDVPAVQAGGKIRKANPLDRRVDLKFN